jgi:hypothetical protein
MNGARFRFEPFGNETTRRNDAQCPICGSLERHRGRTSRKMDNGGFPAALGQNFEATKSSPRCARAADDSMAGLLVARIFER